jgi:hypothetical protein
MKLSIKKIKVMVFIFDLQLLWINLDVLNEAALKMIVKRFSLNFLSFSFKFSQWYSSSFITKIDDF